ncbi:PiggyBac transposable element-derived protein 4 [Anthophora quadrimaculata]
MDKWTNITCDDTEESSGSEPSAIFGEIGYEGKIQNSFCRKRLLSSSSDSYSTSSDELPDIDLRQFFWSAQNLVPKVFEFDENLSGMKANINNILSILEVFQLFFSENLLEHIVRETNNYHTTQTTCSSNSRLMSWKNTTVTDMYRFFAVSMLMSRIKTLSIGEYWSTDELIRTESIPRIMKKKNRHEVCPESIRP